MWHRLLMVLVWLAACGGENNSAESVVVCWDSWAIYYYREPGECRVVGYSFCGTEGQYEVFRRDTNLAIEQLILEGFSELSVESYNELCLSDNF